MYAVKGSNGKLDFKIGQNDFPEKIFLNQTLPDLSGVVLTKSAL
jgi:hypothetical protein